MLGILTALLPSIAKTIGSVVKNKFPESMSEAEKATAEMAIKQAIMEHENDLLETQMSAIVAEAKSQDPWTSRARPSFLYVMYIMILMAIPVGILSVFWPIQVAAGMAGMHLWFAAVPDMLWGIFGTGFLGYVGAREYGKTQILRGKK